MNRSLCIPIFLKVMNHFFYISRHIGMSDWNVPATLYFDPSWPEVPRIRMNVLKRDPMKVKYR